MQSTIDMTFNDTIFGTSRSLIVMFLRPTLISKNWNFIKSRNKHYLTNQQEMRLNLTEHLKQISQL